MLNDLRVLAAVSAIISGVAFGSVIVLWPAPDEPVYVVKTKVFQHPVLIREGRVP